MSINRPKAIELLKGAQAVFDGTSALRERLSDIRREASRASLLNANTPVGQSVRGGLLASVAQVAEISTNRDIDKDLAPIESKLRKEMEARLLKNRAVRWVREHEAFSNLCNHLTWQRSRFPGSKLAAIDSDWTLTIEVMNALFFYGSHQEAGRPPKVTTSLDWDELISAVKRLSNIERRIDVDLSAMIWGSNSFIGLPINWGAKTIKRIEQAREISSKPHADEKLLERDTLKRFTLSLHRSFGRAPVPLVQIFGEYIDYSPSTTKRLVQRWLKEGHVTDEDRTNL